MARTSIYRAEVGPSLKEVTGSPQKMSRYQYEQRFTAASWVGLFMIVAVIGVWAHHRSSAGQSDSPDSAATPSPSASAATPVTLPAWLTESEPSIDDLVAARNNIAAAAALHDIAGTGAACRSASSAVAKLHQQLPSPEPVLNSTLHQAVDSYETGLPDCISATRTQDAEGMRRAATYITQGDAAMRVALEILGRKSGAASPHPGLLMV